MTPHDLKPKPWPRRVVRKTLTLAESLELPPMVSGSGPPRRVYPDGCARFVGQSLVGGPFTVSDLRLSSDLSIGPCDDWTFLDRGVAYGSEARCTLSRRTIDIAQIVRATVAPIAKLGHVHAALVGLWQESLSCGMAESRFVREPMVRRVRTILPLLPEAEPEPDQSQSVYLHYIPNTVARGERLTVECVDAEGRDQSLWVDVCEVRVGNLVQWIGEGPVSASVFHPSSAPETDFTTCTPEMRMLVRFVSRAAAPVFARVRLEALVARPDGAT
jgi:hypothetical protein